MQGSYLPTTIFLSNPTPTTEITTLSLHDALPISRESIATPFQLFCPCHSALYPACSIASSGNFSCGAFSSCRQAMSGDRKSTRLNSSHPSISYAVFCLKKKKSRDYGLGALILTDL